MEQYKYSRKAFIYIPQNSVWLISDQFKLIYLKSFDLGIDIGGEKVYIFLNTDYIVY